jgi:hypothetical protein
MTVREFVQVVNDGLTTAIGDRPDDTVVDLVVFGILVRAIQESVYSARQLVTERKTPE